MTSKHNTGDMKKNLLFYILGVITLPIIYLAFSYRLVVYEISDFNLPEPTAVKCIGGGNYIAEEIFKSGMSIECPPEPAWEEYKKNCSVDTKKEGRWGYVVKNYFWYREECK